MEKEIFNNIIKNKRIEIQHFKKAVPLQTLLGLTDEALGRKTISMKEALENSKSGIIAEYKRVTPNKGSFTVCNRDKYLSSCQENGVTGFSIYTDYKFYKGTIRDLKESRKVSSLPILQKDFILDCYQLFQAKAMGADAVSLIASVLKEDDCAMLATTAHSIGLEVLLEIQNESELSLLNSDIDMLGINNYKPTSADADVNRSLGLIPAIQTYLQQHPDCEPLLVSDGGISDPKQISQLRESGFKGFVIGSEFLKQSNPCEALKSFINNIG